MSVESVQPQAACFHRIRAYRGRAGWVCKGCGEFFGNDANDGTTR